MDWLEHSGGSEPPVDPAVMVRVRLKDGYVSNGYHMAAHIKVWSRVVKYLPAERA